jgi:hypothetical protein
LLGDQSNTRGDCGTLIANMKTPAQQFVDTLDKKDYKALIDWALDEINEYQKFIEILKKKMNG